MLRSARIAGRARCRRRSARSRRRGLDRLEGALTRRLVGTPAQEPGAMAEPAAADMIVANFDDQFWAHWLPFCGALGAPPAGASRRVAGEAGRHDQRFELLRQRLAVEIVQCRGKPDVIELALAVIEAEQQRPDKARVPLIAEPADHAIRRAPFLDLEHSALARLINAVEALGNHPVQRTAARLEPTPCFLDVASEGRKPHRLRRAVRSKKGFESRTA